MSNKRGPGDGTGGGPPKRSRGDKIMARLLVSSRVAGSIIGKGGQNIQKLRTDNNASVRIPDCPGPERIMTIEADDNDTVIAVLEQSLPFMSDEMVKNKPGRDAGPVTNSNRESRLEIRLLVHQSQVGGIIGKQGFKIKEIRETTGAQIKAFQNPAPQSTERIVSLQGSPDKIILAAREVFIVLSENPPKGPDHLYDPINFDAYFSSEYGGHGTENDAGMFSRMSGGGMRGHPGPGFGGSRGPGFGPRGGFGNQSGGPGFGPRRGFGAPEPPMFGSGGPPPLGPEDDLGEVETSQVTIPKDDAGAIIGPGGSRIRTIRSDSRASITIDENVTGNNERIITISGTQKQIQMAQYLLQQCIKKYGSGAQEAFRGTRF